MPALSIPVINVENACASASTAFHQAVNHIRAGVSDVVLAVGSEKMYFDDKERVFGVFDGAWDVHNREGTYNRLKDMAAGFQIPDEVMSSQANQKSRVGYHIDRCWPRRQCTHLNTQLAAIDVIINRPVP